MKASNVRALSKRKISTNGIARQDLKVKMDPKITAQLEHFIEFHHAKRLSKNLRSWLIEFLMFDGATEAAYLNDLLYDLSGLFDLLDTIEGGEIESIQQ